MHEPSRAGDTTVHSELRPGEVAARLDRLPLRRVQWHLALATGAAWGLAIFDDGLVAKLYPYVWSDYFGPVVYSLLNAIQIGVGILVGEYIGGYISDRFGRRFVMIISGIDSGLFMLGIAFTTNPTLLGVLLFLQAMGMGGILAAHSVYLNEIAPPRMRGRLSMGAQSITRVTSFAVIWPFFFFVPGGSPDSYRIAIFILAAAPSVVLLPILFSIPESPRWLEAKGRMAQARRALEKIEYRASKRGTVPLPEPDVESREVMPIKRVPVREIFRGEYGRRSVLLLICWILGYSGVVYGFGAFYILVLDEYKFSSEFVFLTSGLTALAGGGLGFFLNSWANERIERRTSIGLASCVFSVGVLLFYVFSGFIVHSLIVTVISVAIYFMGQTVFLFQMYNYTSAAYPTRLRSIGTGWTDGIGHLGAILGSVVVVALFNATAGAGHIGAYIYVVVVGGLLPGVLIWRFGIRQKEAALEEVSK